MGRTAAHRKPLVVPVSLIQAHPPPRPYRCSLSCEVGVLQPEPQSGIVGIIEVSVGIALQGGELMVDLGQVAGGVMGNVSVVPGTRIIHTSKAAGCIGG
jgi:hypothetical protein